MRQGANAALRYLPRGAVWAAGAVPLGLLLWDLWRGALGVDPVRMIEHRTGRTAIYFLLATLCVTPLLRFARVNAIRFRRPLGLLAFCYAVLHLAAWAALDMGLFWGQALRDVIKRPYLLAGMGALVILAILAATSADSALRRLGAARWRTIHRGIYVAAPLAGLHWLLSQKVPGPKSLAVTGAILGLLALRLWWVRRNSAK